MDFKDGLNQAMSEVVLGRAWPCFGVISIDEDDLILVGVKADPRRRDVIGDDKVALFAHELLASIPFEVLGLSREANESA